MSIIKPIGHRWQLIKCLFLVFLCGCMVGPDYHRPPLDIPETFHYADQNADPENEDYLNHAWWKEFDDDVINDLILEALANNKDVKIAAANIDNALGILIQTRAPLFPQIGYNGSVSRMRNSQSLAANPMSNALSKTMSSSMTPTMLPAIPISIPNPQTIWQALLTGSWDIDVWGRIRRQVEAARANLYATVESRYQVILSLIASVANSYFQLRSLDEQLAISIRTMNSYGESVTYFENQFKYGQTSQMTVVQAKTQYELAAAKIPQLKSQIAQTENAISILLGSNPKPIPRGKTINDLSMPFVPADLPSDLLTQRPDIKQAEQDLISANALIGAAKALYFPSISLTGSYGNASQALHKLFTGPATTWNYVGSIIGPIFTGGAIYGQVMQAESQQKAALINYEKIIQNAFAEVEDALVNHTMLVDQIEALKKLVEASGEYVRLATLQYKGGYAPYFIVIQAQEQYFPAELSFAQTRGLLLSSMVDIYQSMGGGWVELAEMRTIPNCTIP